MKPAKTVRLRVARGRVVAAAYRWWLGRRPLVFTAKMHRASPTVNTSGDTELDLAAAVGRLERLRVERVERKRGKP